MIMIGYGILLLFLPVTAEAGFDLGAFGNNAFWVGLVLWSMGIAFILFRSRDRLVAFVLSLLGAFFGKRRPRVVVSTPKYRPIVDTEPRVGRAPSTAQSYLQAATAGASSVVERAQSRALITLRDVQRASGKVLAAAQEQLTNERVVTAVKKQLQRAEREGTPVVRVTEAGLPKVELYRAPSLIGPSVKDYERERIKILAAAHRAMIRARHAREHLPKGGVIMTDTAAERAIEAVRDIHDETLSTALLEPSLQTQKVVDEEEHTMQALTERVARHVQPAESVARIKPKTQEQVSVDTHTKDSLKLDVSSGTPRLILTRK
jgi:hypothetical protein